MAIQNINTYKEPVYLFTNWNLIDAGRMLLPVDRSKVPEEILKDLIRLESKYQVRLEEGRKPPELVNLASGVTIFIEKARKNARWLLSEKPWEKRLGHCSLLWEQGKYRLWYAADYKLGEIIEIEPDRFTMDYGACLCYAESTDGFNWERSSLGLCEYEGSKDNNIVSFDPLLVNGTVFLDEHAPEEERYKLIGGAKLRYLSPKATSGGALVGAVSPDGFHWTPFSEPLCLHISDTQQVAYFDEKINKYVGYFRSNYQRRRSISRAETEDFRRWPVPQIILTPGPEEMPSDDFYTNGYTKYPAATCTHLMFSSIYHRDTDTVDVRLASSVDGIAWNWVSKEPIIELGKPGEWDSGTIYPSPQMVHLPGPLVAVPIQGNSLLHNEYWRSIFEKNYPAQNGLGWAIWEEGRIAGIWARQRGEFTTLPVPVSGARLEMNFKTGKAGFVKVEFLREDNSAIEGYTSDDCEPLQGDEIWGTVNWNNSANISQLRDNSARLRVTLFDAKVYGFRFR
ncbi:hypothetical protein FJZ31_27260 [Candidatus Poribacteria bacterium]|nr:hypothetical protein [Candidatus Poribacteria bacterium]